MKVFLNPGHDLKYDSGAVNPYSGMRECDVAAEVGSRVKVYLEAVGIKCEIMQSDNLAPTRAGRSYEPDRQGLTVTETANKWGADLFISIHCNALNGEAAGTETYAYDAGDDSDGAKLAQCIQNQIIGSFDLVDRGTKSGPKLLVLRYTDMPAVLVELGFIDNEHDVELLRDKRDDFARAIARGVTDYEQSLA